MAHPTCLTRARLARDLEGSAKELATLRKALDAAERRADEFEDKYGDTLFALLKEQTARNDWQTRCKGLQAKLERLEDAQRRTEELQADLDRVTHKLLMLAARTQNGLGACRQAEAALASVRAQLDPRAGSVVTVPADRENEN